MLDLKKAFDTVNHEIFLDKLGISKYCIQWFKSYLMGLNVLLLMVLSLILVK